jgi:prepilin-type N-terminal cleavage/methylation domain-containing protein
MTHIQSFSSKRRGFTLVELLVVIAIIAVLAALGFAGFNMAIQRAKKTSAQTCMSQLIIACDDYFEAYQQLPLGSKSNADEEQKSDNKLMAALLGMESAEDENYKLQSYFTFKASNGKGQGAYDGLERTQNRAELLGPWQNKQKDDRYYRLMFNYDYDKELREPQALGNEIMYDKNVLIYHMGKDGKVGGKNDQDNVYSWQKSK